MSRLTVVERNAARVTALGERLRTHRLASGMSRVELAEASGVSEDCVAKTERGSRPPNLSTLQQLADGLGVDMLVLLGGAA